jgi:integrase
MIKRLLSVLGEEPKAIPPPPSALTVASGSGAPTRVRTSRRADTFASSPASAQPPVLQWRLSALPRYLPTAEVERMIASCDLATPLGLRDQAILLLLGRLGLRAGDICCMRLDDFDWAAGTLRVSGKSRRGVRLPLPQDVGDAVLAYIEHGRPAVTDDRLFCARSRPIAHSRRHRA